MRLLVNRSANGMSFTIFKLRSMLFVSIVLVLGMSPSFGEGAPAPVQKFLVQVDKAFQSIGQQAGVSGQACEVLITSAMDIDTIAATVAAEMISRPSRAQAARLKVAVTSRFQRECRDLRDDVGRHPLDVLSTRKKGSLWIVTTRAQTPNGRDRTIVWKLKPGGVWGMQAEDMVVDGRGIISALLSEMNNRLTGNNGNIDDAIAALAR